MEYYSVMKRNKLLYATLGWISKTLCSVKAVSLKRLYTGWFHLYDILRKTKYSGKNRSVGRGGRRE